jgi:hypothetical protein
MFGDDALQRLLSAGPKQVSTIAMEFIAELNPAIGIAPDKALQLGSALRESLLPEVFAVEMQKIEGVGDDAVGSDSHSRLKRLEVRTAVAILDNSLTINDC